MTIATPTVDTRQLDKEAQLRLFMKLLIDTLSPQLFTVMQPKEMNFSRIVRRWGFLWRRLQIVDRVRAISLGGPEQYANGMQFKTYFLREDGQIGITGVDFIFEPSFGKPMRFAQVITPSYDTLVYTAYQHLWFLAGLWNLSDDKSRNLVTELTEQAQDWLDPDLYDELVEQQVHRTATFYYGR